MHESDQDLCICCHVNTKHQYPSDVEVIEDGKRVLQSELCNECQLLFPTPDKPRCHEGDDE
jgi:hypothetical protein